MKTASGTPLFLLLFMRVSSQITEIQRDSRIYAFNVNSNLSFVGHEFRNHQISNFSTKFLATQCAMECHRTARCQSFNFASKTRHCLLNDATHEDFPEDLANDSSTTGIVYYLKEAISINPDAIGPCGNHPCKNGGRCLDTVSAVTGNRTFFCLCQNGWKGGVCDIKEDSLGWAQWVEWSQCSTTCGNGYHIRQRKCKNLDNGVDLASSQCYGRDTEYKACQFRKCPMWNEWEVWGECSTLNSCGKGSRSRTRTCGNGGTPGVDRYCLGPVNETMACDSVPCNGMVRLRDGEKFGEGRVEMYHSHSKKWMQVCGERWTQRSADTACKQRGFLGAHKVLTDGAYGKSDRLDVVSLECTGSESFLHQCLRVRADQCSVMAGVQCMVRGAWSLWSSWGDCSVTCENGTRTRTRVCNHPPPNFGGRECPDTDLEYKPCTMIMCPVDGIWREWSTWSECSVSCANGTKYRTRSCLGPFHEGKNCSGDYSETTDCFPKECPVDGVWNEWMQWSDCTVSCGYGTRNRSRTCKGPYYKGKECDGPKDETESCNAFSCPVDGSWKTWNGWESCSVTCGGGIQNRTRECNLPLHGGETCIGHSEESRKCNEHPCPVDGVWTAWADWSDCSVTCANGTQWRNRTCVGPLYGGMNCTGDETQEKICVAASCPVNGVWRQWSEWDSCNVTCGGGEKSRRRECNGPFFDGDPCEGPTEERLTCNTFNCPIDGVWEAWTTWTSCSRPCGTGEQVRSRNCVGPFYNGSDCLGDWNQTKTCNTHSCAVPGDWMSWSGWSRCSATCGTGIRWRTRDCNETSYGDLTAPCEGTSNGTEDCNTFPCRPYAATCSNLRDMGMVDSGLVQLKPERRDLYSDKPELEPVWLYCDMESEGGIGVTVVGHDKEARTNVNGYEGAGSYLAKVTYKVSTDHVIALIDQSKFCKQFLRWECKGAVIHNPHQKDSWTTFWTNRSSEFNQYNTPATYFPGAKPGSGNCACGDTGTCTNKSLSCNCDSNDFEWRSDEGFVTYKDDLPILAFRAGDTGNEPVEQGAHTIGRVYCHGVA